MNVFCKVLKKIKEKYIAISAPIRRKKLLKSDFTIISNNCWAGDVYRYFGLPYNTPTVGLYFWAEDYIKFLSNLKYYLKCPLTFITAEESKYKELLIEKKQCDKVLARLDDVEIVFLHYSTKEEAEEKWVRRAERVNFENLVVKFSRQNHFKEEDLIKFGELPYAKKIFFDNRKNSQDFSVYIKGYEHSDSLSDDISTYRKHMDILKFINS